MSITLGQALKDPSISADLNKYYDGDAKKLEPAAKAGDVRAQQLRTKIFQTMSSGATAPIVTQSETKTTTPKYVVPTQNSSGVDKNLWANKTTELLQKPVTTEATTGTAVVGGTQETGVGGTNESESYTNTSTRNAQAVDSSELEKARAAMNEAKTAYIGTEEEGSGFESKLRQAIQDRLDFYKDLNEKKSSTIKKLGTIDEDVKAQYGAALAESPDALHNLMTKERGIYEAQLATTNDELKQRQGYLDDIINAGVNAEEARIKVAKLKADAAEENYGRLKEDRKELMDFLDDNYEGTAVETYKRQFLQELGYNLSSENGVVSTSTGSAYNISSYATDPQHETSVQNILLGIGQLKSVDEMDNYIKSKASSSPITGEMVAKASEKYGVDWEAIIAMMQQDSSLGTAGKGAKTYNPGNVGNDDSGNIRNYGDWQSGVNAVAQWLSKHKVSGQEYTETLTPKASGTETEKLKAQTRNIVDNGKSRGLTRDQVETALYNINVDPTSGYYGNYLDSVYGEKTTSKIPADLTTKSQYYLSQINKGDTEFVKYDSTGKATEIKWSSVPAAYRERVKKLYEANSTPAEVSYPWWSFPQKIKEIGK